MKLCPDAYWIKLEELESDPRGELAKLLDFVGLNDSRYPWESALWQIKHGKLN